MGGEGWRCGVVGGGGGGGGGQKLSMLMLGTIYDLIIVCSEL